MKKLSLLILLVTILIGCAKTNDDSPSKNEPPPSEDPVISEIISDFSKLSPDMTTEEINGKLGKSFKERSSFGDTTYEWSYDDAPLGNTIMLYFSGGQPVLDLSISYYQIPDRKANFAALDDEKGLTLSELEKILNCSGICCEKRLIGEDVYVSYVFRNGNYSLTVTLDETGTIISSSNLSW